MSYHDEKITMKRIATLAIIVVAGLSVTACGSSKSTTSKAVQRTAQQAGTGYYNMVTLANKIKEQTDAVSGDNQLMSVICRSGRPQYAECEGTYTTGAQGSITVKISPDGTSFQEDESN
jgi:hypothetical protein